MNFFDTVRAQMQHLNEGDGWREHSAAHGQSDIAHKRSYESYSSEDHREAAVEHDIAASHHEKAAKGVRGFHARLHSEMASHHRRLQALHSSQ